MYLHLTQLKKRVLSPEILSSTRFDDRLSAVAAGVAAHFDSYTGRKLARTIDHEEEFDGNREAIFLQAYPVESITTLQSRVDDDETFETLDYQSLRERSGIVNLSAPVGYNDSSIKVVYTGGYFVDLSADLDGTLPSGATAIPADLLDAWVLQTDHECRVRRIFGKTSDEDITGAFDDEIDLLRKVERTLRQYIKPA